MKKQENNRHTLHVQGMTCVQCEQRIEKALSNIPGVSDIKANHVDGSVHFRAEIAPELDAAMAAALEKAGYPITDARGDKPFTLFQFISVAVVVFLLYLIIRNTIGFDFLPTIVPGMSLGLLFAVGLATSLHCIAMCGGINLSQTMVSAAPGGNATTDRDATKASPTLARLRPGLLYNGGRVVSYTIIGGLVGALGSVFQFSGPAKGIVAVIAGLFMLIMGANLLGFLPGLSRLIPRMPKGLATGLRKTGKGRGPFYVGLLNGFMPCGPLQAMQLYALGTGSFMMGAASMFFFSLGTVPLMLALSFGSTFLSARFNRGMIKVGAILVVALGIMMLGRGLNLAGMTIPDASTAGTSATTGTSAGSSSVSGNVAKIENGVQIVTTTLEGGTYKPFTVQKGIPVKWTFHAEAADITGCNGTVTVPQFNISVPLKAGDNLIEFTPTESGTIRYTCWMGMISSKITVVDDAATPATAP